MTARWAVVLLLWLSLAPAARAQDMRSDAVEAERRRAALVEKAQAEKAAAQQEAEESRQRILADRNALEAAVKTLRAEKRRLETEAEALERRLADLAGQETAARVALDEQRAAFQDLTGYLRTRAREVAALLAQNQLSALAAEPHPDFSKMAVGEAFPGMDAIGAMGRLLLEQMRRSGEVRIVRGPFIDRSGKQVEGDLLLLGSFSAAYRTADETGFLLYSDTSNRLFALSRPPGRRVAGKLRDYMAGRSEAVYIDIGRGAALRQYAHRLSLMDRIRKGGPLVWPILTIGALALLIVAERLFTLSRKHLNADRLMRTLTGLIDAKEWEQCRSACSRHDQKPISRVLLAGIDFHESPRTEMENALQEAILHEIPSLERFLSTLGMLGSIAPLLGLLGTVTGMINTFQAITFHGTSNPRIMSGGISEALVTTMLGLAVAIPILLAHSLLSRWVERVIGEMEEKAVAYVNCVCKGAVSP
jgi:biopolymer transport protein ExbB